MKIAQVYPHSKITVPLVNVFDALAIVNYEIGRRLAGSHKVTTYPKWVRGQREIETYEGVTFRRVPEGIDKAINKLRLLDDRVFKHDRPFRLSPLYYANYARRVALDIQARQCELVHIHSVSNFILPIRKRNPNARLVLHMHDHSLADFDPKVLAPRLAETSLIVGCSNFVIDAIRKRFPAIAGRCHTLYNGVDKRFLEIRSDPARSQTVLFVGRLCPEKGVHVLLEAMKGISDPLATHLSLVGPLDVAPKEYVDPLRQDPLFRGLEGYYSRPATYRDLLVREVASLQGRAVLEGPVLNRDIGPRFGGAGIFVFPSLWHEPFGIPVIEAMAAGLPVVATRGGALPEIVVDGETGFLVERGDVQGLRAAITRLLLNPSLRAKMGAAGRQRVKKLFTWESCVDRLQELYTLSASPGALDKLTQNDSTELPQREIA